MQSTSPNSKFPLHAGNSQPLFRPEVLAARDNINGEILLARPLSLTLLSWTAVALVAIIVSFFVLGRYTPVQTVPASISPAPENYSQGESAEATVTVPADSAATLKPGATLVLLCPNRDQSDTLRIRGEILAIDPGVRSAETRAKIRVVLKRADLMQLFPDKVAATAKQRIEAEITLPQESLYRWIFQPGNPTSDRS